MSVLIFQDQSKFITGQLLTEILSSVTKVWFKEHMNKNQNLKFFELKYKIVINIHYRNKFTTTSTGRSLFIKRYFQSYEIN